MGAKSPRNERKKHINDKNSRKGTSEDTMHSIGPYPRCPLAKETARKNKNHILTNSTLRMGRISSDSNEATDARAGNIRSAIPVAGAKGGLLLVKIPETWGPLVKVCRNGVQCKYLWGRGGLTRLILLCGDPYYEESGARNLQSLGKRY